MTTSPSNDYIYLIIYTNEINATIEIIETWLGVLIAINLQTSFLSPPFGFALFYLRGVAPKEIKTMQIYKGVMPFIVIQLLALGLIAFWPEIATWLPGVLG